MNRHESQRGWFAWSLLEQMRSNPDIFLLTGDLGYLMLDPIRNEMPYRFLNCGAAEQAMVGAAIGIAMQGKIPFCYSITPFLLCRPFEWIRNYVNHEVIPVRLVGGGLDGDYKHDGFTHHAYDAKKIMKLFPNITTYFPTEKEEVPEMVQQMVTRNEPSFLCLRR